MKKYCYICIPIAGREQDVFERAAKAAKEIKNLGYIPLSPLDLNEIGEKELVNHTEIQMTAWYMGRDIDMIIRDCDAIYCCEGWEKSKGCNVERECAKQYNRDVLYQVPYDVRKDVKLCDEIKLVQYTLHKKFYEASKEEIPDKDYCNALLRDIKEFEKICKKYFNSYYDLYRITDSFIKPEKIND